MSDHWKIKARPTRGGWRAVAFSKRGRVAFKTVPVYRSPDDAVAALRAELKGDKKRGSRSSRPGSHGDWSLPTYSKIYVVSFIHPSSGKRASETFYTKGAALTFAQSVFADGGYRYWPSVYKVDGGTRQPIELKVSRYASRQYASRRQRGTR